MGIGATVASVVTLDHLHASQKGVQKSAIAIKVISGETILS